MKSLRTLLPILIAATTACGPAGKRPVRFQPMDLYDIQSGHDTNQIDGFKQVNIFSDEYSSEVWVSPEKACVTMEKVNSPTFEGTAALHITWDKISGGCKWIGVGFGWNDWIAKDMTGLTESAAIQLQVRSVKGSFANFPVAFAVEDYSGAQTYCGFNAKHAEGLFTDSTWTTVTIPLREFPFKRKNADLSKVKQFMIQLEGDGDIYLDDIRIIRYQQ